MTPVIAAELQLLSRHGYRTLAVASGSPGKMMFVGLVALNDPPRPDSPALLAEPRSLGVHTVMGSAEGQDPAKCRHPRGGARDSVETSASYRDRLHPLRSYKQAVGGGSVSTMPAAALVQYWTSVDAALGARIRAALEGNRGVREDGGDADKGSNVAR